MNAMENNMSVFPNEILINENVGLNGTVIPIEFGGRSTTDQQVKTKTVSIMDFGKMLLHCAKTGDTSKVLELMGRGAPFTTDWLGRTPLHVAAEGNHYQTCEVLLRAGISKDARTKVDKTPLHFAAFEGHELIVQLLLKHCCDANAKDMLKMTPLHWAVQKQHVKIAKMLVTNGSDPGALSKFLKTPIILAMELKLNDLVDELTIQNLQRSELEQQQATDTLVHELNSDPDLSVEMEDIDEISDTTEMEIASSPESNSVFTTNFETLTAKQDSDSANALTLALLKQHGIAIQEDTDNTLITSALESGRQLILSDAGKLLLNDPKFKKCTPSISQQSKHIVAPLSTQQSIVTTKPAVGGSTYHFVSVKKKPTILTANKVDTNQLVKVFSAKEFKLMLDKSKNIRTTKPNGLMRYQTIKNPNMLSKVLQQNSPRETISNNNISTGLLTGTLKTTKPDVKNFQQIHAPNLSMIQKKVNADVLSRVSFNVINSKSTKTNILQTATTTCNQIVIQQRQTAPHITPPYTVKLVQVPQKYITTSTKSQPQLVHQLNNPLVQTRQIQPQIITNGTEMSHRTEIEQQIAELKRETQELRRKLELSEKQNDEYKFRLEKLETEKEKEREDRLSRQYTY